MGHDSPCRGRAGARWRCCPPSPARRRPCAGRRAPRGSGRRCSPTSGQPCAWPCAGSHGTARSGAAAAKQAQHASLQPAGRHAVDAGSSTSTLFMRSTAPSTCSAATIRLNSPPCAVNAGAPDTAQSFPSRWPALHNTQQISAATQRHAYAPVLAGRRRSQCPQLSSSLLTPLSSLLSPPLLSSSLLLSPPLSPPSSPTSPPPYIPSCPPSHRG